MLESPTPRQILAAFTMARRLHAGMSQAALARQLRLRADQISKCESGKPCGHRARARLLAWNELSPDEVQQ
jgi:ribosome-binding protein aMBF1 (putative translation factor)